MSLHQLSSNALQSDNLLPNYFDSSNTFSDTASSALLASAAFRLGQLDQPQHYSNTIVAQLIRGAVNEKIDATTGWVQNVVVRSLSLVSDARDARAKRRS